MKQITVTIPAQEFSINKYMGINRERSCYLDDALQQVLPHSQIVVKGFGKTLIDGVEYAPKEEFSIPIVVDAFSKGQDIKVTLIRL